MYGSEESRAEYTRLIGQWQRRQDGAPKGMTVGQLCLLFIEHADGYYLRDGEPTGEAGNFRKSAKYLNGLFRTLPVEDFGPKRLLEVRQRMIDDGVVRKSINRHVARLKHIFKWGVSQELVSAEVHTALSTVSGKSSQCLPSGACGSGPNAARPLAMRTTACGGSSAHRDSSWGFR